MRLLHRDKHGKFSFTKDLIGHDPIPPYAILSHTWGLDKEEVIFKDMINGTGEDKPGYEKIRFCGEQASQDGLQYFWIDTCCIDKTNKAELSRSINSMFHWYRSATRCYVYLSDVSTLKRKRDEDLRDIIESDFRRSKWFTRGWTLQELLAPASVEFFSSDRRRLGDKSSLGRLIKVITNIPQSALEETPLSQFSAHDRMSWMEYRETKLEEDRAYSLLGIFGVRIPPVYGEGGASAFKRLQKEIDRLETCTKDLRLTDPRDDKNRIEDTKGGLLDDSYCWVVKNPEFGQWWNDQQSRLLWIKGDPGKGKTMLLCGIINEIKKSLPKSALLSYFFCQATDSRINNATAVLRGLIYMLVNQQPFLLSHVLTKYEQAGKLLFEDTNAWVALSEILTNILQDPNLQSIYLVVDGLDECTDGLPALLDFVARTSSTSPRIKWLVSGRNSPQIEERLEQAESKVRLSLELNAESVSAAVNIFIRYKVHQLAQEKKYDNETQEAVLQYLFYNANDTFLWVALVCQNLESIPRARIRARLTSFPPGLDSFYERMIAQICRSADSELCLQILATIATVYAPITLTELTSLVELLEDTSDDVDSLHELISLCGSFLTVRKDRIYFIHQSAKDYLLTFACNTIFPSGRGNAHYAIFSRSLKAMSQTLQQDIYKLRLPGTSINSVKVPNPDPLAPIRYPCINWASHFQEVHKSSFSNQYDLTKEILQFLQKYLLYWLEALSLIGKVSEGVISIAFLESSIQADKNPNLYAFVYDAKRFVLYNRSVIETTPLQVYLSALVFAPEKSIVREQFKKKYISNWIEMKWGGEENWSAVQQTLEGHSDSIRSVAFSPDGKLVASGSFDKTVRLWDASTGVLRQALEGHSDSIWSVAFSPDGKLVASGSDDKTVRLWDAGTGVLRQTLEGHSSTVRSVAFSPDGKLVASGSVDKTVWLWDAGTGVLRQMPEGHSDSIWSVAFSPDGKLVASGSADKTVRLWDAGTGVLRQTLKGHSSTVRSVAFSPDGKLVASGSDDKTVWLWDAGTGVLRQALEGHSSTVTSVAFSPDGKLVASGSFDNTVRLWDADTGVLRQALEGHSSTVTSVAFSTDGKLVASGSADNTVRLWDAGTGVLRQMPEGHWDSIWSVAFSPDGKLVASGSADKTVRLWDAGTGVLRQALEGHLDYIWSVAFSPDGKLVASGSADNTVRLWDAGTGVLRQALEGHSSTVTSVTFSLDGKLVASGSDDKTVRLWDAGTGVLRQALEGHSDSIWSIAFSPDGKLVASGSADKTVRLWDAGTGVLRQALEGHSNFIWSLAFWNNIRGVALQSLKGTLFPQAVLVDVKRDWVTVNGQETLWLPPDYRRASAAIYNSVVAIGCPSGRVFVLQIYCKGENKEEKEEVF